MIKPIAFEKNKFFLIRKGIGISVLIFGIICLCLMVIGFVPMRNQQLSVIGAFNLFLESLIWFSSSFWYNAIACAAISIVYFVFVIKTVKNIFQFIKSLRYWANDTVDSAGMREETRAMVDAAGMILWRLLLLYVLSYMLSAFSVTFLTVFVLTVLIVMSIGIRAMQNVLYSGDVETGISSSLGFGMILASILIFTITSFSVQIVDVFQCVKLMVANEEGVARSMIFSQNIFLPAMYIVTLIFLVVLYPLGLRKIYNSKKKNESSKVKIFGKKISTFFVIQNIVLFIAWFILMVCINNYSHFMEYVNTFFDHILLVMIPVILYLCLKNAFDYAEDQFQVSEKMVEVAAEETSVEE